MPADVQIVFAISYSVLFVIGFFWFASSQVEAERQKFRD
jgi:hypothetical protein